MTIIVRIFPNGEVTQGVDTSNRKKDRTHPLQGYRVCRDEDNGKVSLQWEGRNADISNKTLEQYIGTTWQGESGFTWQVLEAYQDCTVMRWWDLTNTPHEYIIHQPVMRAIAEMKLSPLGLSNGRNLDNPQQSRKQCKSMTKHMARGIRNGVYLLESEYGKHQMSFLTLTLPGLSKEDLANVCANWGQATNRILKWLTDRLENAGIKPQYVYCTEIQIKRLHNRGEYAPHIHIVFRGRNGRKAPWVITPKKVRKAWSDIIRSYTSADFNTSALENLRQIRKSAARYLSKYMSKGAMALPSDCDEGQAITQLKTQWGGMSRDISRAIRKNTVRIDGSNPRYLDPYKFVQYADDMVNNGILAYWKRGEILIYSNGNPKDNRYLKVGSGCLSRPVLQGGLKAVIDYLNKKELEC